MTARGVDDGRVQGAHPDIAEVLAGTRRWAIAEGNCLGVMAAMPAKSVDHVITDPPYEVEAHTKERRTLKDATQKRGAVNTGEVRRIDGTLSFDAIDMNTREAAADEFFRLSRRWSVVFCQIEAIAVWRGALVSAGLEWIRGGIWRKPDGMPQFTGDRPGQGFESIAIAHPAGRKRWNGGGRHAVWTVPLDHSHGGGGKSGHPTMKPIALMLALIADFTDPDDIVLDPFCGSASTGVAALRMGRRFIGCELKPEYAALSRERLTAEGAGHTVADERAGQTSLFGKTGTP